MCLDMFDFYILYSAKIKILQDQPKYTDVMYNVLKFCKHTHSGHLESTLELLPLSPFRKSD